MPFRLPLLAAGLLFTSTTFAEDWPAFRGPNRDGICKEKGLLKTWPKDGPPVAWTAKNLGIGFSTPTIVKGIIYGVGTRDGKEGIWALKESDGSELWFTECGEGLKPKPGQNNGPNSSATYDDGKVYAVSSAGKLVCLDAEKGTKIWDRAYVADFGGQVPIWGYSDSVLIDGDNLICVPCGSRGSVVALNKKTGKDVWKSDAKTGDTQRDGAGYSSPIKVKLAGKAMYVSLLGLPGGLVGLDPETGKMLWQYKGKASGGGVAQIPIPVISGDNIFVSCAYDGGSAFLKIEADGSDKFKATELKTYKKLELCNHHGGMVQVGNYAYLGHNQNQGNPACIDLKTGEITWGPEKNPAGGNGSAAVLFADGLLYFRYDNGTMVLIEPSPEKLKVVSSFKETERSGKPSWAHPVIVNGKMYLRDQDKLTCFNVKAK